MTISAIDRIRLEGMLGMLGSAYIGERDNAAKLIEQFLRQRGLTWADVLGRHAERNDGSGNPASRPYRAFQQSPPRPAYARPIRIVSSGQDVVWRWSMLFGLVVVGAISLMSLMQLRLPDQNAMANLAAEDRCQIGAARGDAPPCPVVFTDSANPPGSQPARSVPAAAAPGDRRRQQASFAQGVADRKVAETWHKLAPAGLCTARFGPDRPEFRSACVMADKLLAQFDQRRRTDPDYRRGWTSAPASGS